MNNVYMGLDQSFTGTGITIFPKDYFLIETEKTKNTKTPSIDNTRRIIKIRDEVKEILNKYKVTHICMEGLSYGSKGRSVMQIGGLTHILRELFIELNIKFIVIPPKTLKKWFTGNGNSNKFGMIEEAVKRDYDIPFVKNYGNKKNPNIQFDDNVVDSLAACLFCKDFIEGKADEYKDLVELSWLYEGPASIN